MAEIKTQPVTRNKLATFLDNHELIKLLENLVQDVAINTPAGLSEVEETADMARSIAQAANVLASLALQMVAQVDDGPPPVNDLRERVAMLERAVAELNEGTNRL